MFSFERIVLKLLALKGFDLVGLEYYKAKKSLYFKLGSLLHPPQRIGLSVVLALGDH